MKIIKVSDYIASAFSQEKALILREIIKNNLEENDEIVLDFSGIFKFTTLFFNFSTGYYISLLGPNVYDKKISLINLCDLGKSTYVSSYNNAVTKNDSSKEMQEKITEIITNPEN